MRGSPAPAGAASASSIAATSAEHSGGEVAVQHAGALERGLQGQVAVQVLVIVVVRVRRGGAVPDLGADLGQRPQVRPGPRRQDQDFLGRLAELPGITRVHLASCSATGVVTELSRSPVRSTWWSRASSRSAR
jgi:hypothetical protein